MGRSKWVRKILEHTCFVETPLQNKSSGAIQSRSQHGLSWAKPAPEMINYCTSRKVDEEATDGPCEIV